MENIKLAKVKTENKMARQHENELKKERTMERKEKRKETRRNDGELVIS